jgi:hypothetical protein
MKHRCLLGDGDIVYKLGVRQQIFEVPLNRRYWKF